MGRVLGLLLFVLLSLTGCNRPDVSQPGASGRAPLRIGIQPNVSHAVPLIGLADEDGSLRVEMPGVEFDVKTFNAGPALMESLKAGALDVAVLGPPGILLTAARTDEYVVLTNAADGGSVLVARPDSGIRSVADLSGRTVAVPQVGNVQDVFLRVLLRRIGLKATDRGGTVTVLPLESAVILTQMRAGDIDAALVPEPWGTRLEREAGAEPLLEWDELPLGGDYPQALLVANRRWVDAHPETARALIDAMERLTARVAQSPAMYAEEVSAEIMKRSGRTVPPDLVRDSFRRVRFQGGISESDLRAFAGLLVEAGYLKEIPDTDGLIVRPMAAGR